MTDRPASVAGVAGSVVEALRTSPVLLLIVLLNMAFAGAASYYLVNVENHRVLGTQRLLDLLEKCTLHTVPLEALPTYQQHKEHD